MAETLVIRLPAAAEPAAAPVADAVAPAHAEWVVVDSTGALLQPATAGALSEAVAASENRRVFALAPASAVLRTTASIPLRSPAKIRQALPFALEEQLAREVDGQHFACGKRSATGEVEVAVVDETALTGWLDALTAAGLHFEGLFAESDALAALPATITVLVERDRVIIRDATGGSTVADHESLQAVLELLLEQDDATDVATDDESDTETAADAADPPAEPAGDGAEPDGNEPINLLVYCHPQVHERHAMLWEMLRLRVASLDVKLLEDGGLARLASELVNSGGVNLLQGPYAPKTDLGINWAQWRVAAVLLVGFAALFVVREGVDYWQLTRQEARLDAAASELLSNTFRNAGNPEDPWPELRSRLGVIEAEEAAAQGPGFAEGMEVIAAAFAKTPDIEFEALSYRDGKLDVQLVAPDVEQLDQLRKRIIEPGTFAAEIQSANPDEDKIKGRMKIEATGGA